MKQENIPIYEKKFKVHSYLIDPNRRLSLQALFWLFGEAAHYDAGRRGWGYQEMIDRHQAWVLIRALVEVRRMPVWEEEITLKTWPRMMEGVQAYRDFTVLDQAGSRLAAGSTVWSLLDLATRRPVRMSGVEYKTGSLAGLAAIDRKPEKIAWPSDMCPVNRFKARYSQLDMNLHVNNARYLEWIINEVPMDIVLNNEIRMVEANFLSEIKPEDEIEILMKPISKDNRAFYGLIRKKPADKPVFAAVLTFW